MTPFEKFFAGEFQRRIEAVGDAPGALTLDQPLSEASWDRKAAWLLWCATVAPHSPDPAPTDVLDDLLG